MIRLICPGCQKKLAVDDAKAGKSGKCPACAGPIRIPQVSEAEQVPAVDKVTTARKPAPTVMREAVAAAPKRSTPPPVPRGRADDYDDPADNEEEERPRKRRKKKKKRRAAMTMGTFLGLAGATGAIFLLFLVVSMFSIYGVYGLLLAGLALEIGGNMWFASIARQESELNYLLVRWVPFYSFYYFFSRIQATYKPFIFSIIGIVFLIAGWITYVVHDVRGILNDPAPMARFNFPRQRGIVVPGDNDKRGADLLQRGGQGRGQSLAGSKSGACRPGNTGCRDDGARSGSVCEGRQRGFCRQHRFARHR